MSNIYFDTNEHQKELDRIRKSKIITHVCSINSKGMIQLPSAFYKSLGELKNAYAEIIENTETKEFRLMIHCDRFDITKRTVIVKQKVPKIIDFSEIDPRYKETENEDDNE